MKKRVVLMVLILLSLLFISACTVEWPKIEWGKPFLETCCMISDTNTGDFLGCVGSLEHSECNEIFNKGYNVVFDSAYCEEVEDCESQDNDCFHFNKENHLVYYAKNGARGCFEDQVYICRYIEAEDKVTFEVLEDCPALGLPCWGGNCVRPSTEGGSGNGGGGSSGRSSTRYIPSEEIIIPLESCNNNEVCEIEFEDYETCPSDCSEIQTGKILGTKEEKTNYLIYMLIIVIGIITIIIGYKIIKLKKNERYKKHYGKKRKKK